MGANYYWISRPTRIISRADRPRSTQIHVGKSGWIFRGWDAGDQPDETSVFEFEKPIRSRREWGSFFIANAGGKIVNQYGEGMRVTPYAWVMGIRPPNAEEIARQDAAELESRRRGPVALAGWADKRWRDPEGFRFIGDWFS